MNKLISMICCVLALTLCLTACGQRAASNEGGQSLAKGGVLVLSVNPEIAVEYNENGTVTGVTARNDDALAIINSCTGLIGQPTREVVTDLVTAIGEAGYFVEEIEGERRQLTLEIEPGSSLPNDAFLDDVIADIRDAVNQHDWSTPLVVEGESDFGISDYADTDYAQETETSETDYIPETTEGESDYGETDYVPEETEGESDYGETDYIPEETEGESDYGETDYVPEETEGESDYGETDYIPEETEGESNYDDGQSDNNDGNSNYDDGQSDYNDGNSNYDDGQSDYNDGNSNYGDSAYDDGSDYDD